MSILTGPVKTLPGSKHFLPSSAKCENHPEKKAVIRIQGETDDNRVR